MAEIDRKSISDVPRPIPYCWVTTKPPRQRSATAALSRVSRSCRKERPRLGRHSVRGSLSINWHTAIARLSIQSTNSNAAPVASDLKPASAARRQAWIHDTECLHVPDVRARSDEHTSELQ